MSVGSGIAVAGIAAAAACVAIFAKEGAGVLAALGGIGFFCLIIWRGMR